MRAFAGSTTDEPMYDGSIYLTVFSRNTNKKQNIYIYIYIYLYSDWMILPYDRVLVSATSIGVYALSAWSMHPGVYRLSTSITVTL